MATTVPAPNWSNPIVDPAGFPTRWFRAFLEAVYSAGADLRAATATANAAAPASALVVASGGLHGGGPIGANAGVSLYKARASVALLPSTGLSEGDWAYALNGRKPAEGAGVGTGVPVSWSRGAWISVYSGVAVTA